MTVKDIRNIRKPVEEPVEAPEPKPELRQGRKPTEEEREILNILARILIGMYKIWMLEDFHTRVMNVTTSYQEVRNRLSFEFSRYTIWFTGQGASGSCAARTCLRAMCSSGKTMTAAWAISSLSIWLQLFSPCGT